MYTVLPLVSHNENLQEYTSAADLEKSYKELGCDGLEIIQCDNDERNIINKESIIGFHIGFYSQWLDFWLGDEKRLLEEFGERKVWEEFYGGTNKEALIKYFKKELDMAQELGVRYVVFHVSEVTTKETLTYDYHYTDEEIIDETIELVNGLLENSSYEFEFLMENLWWPGFTFTKPQLTKRLLEGIRYDKKGIMLDVGHLMHTNLELRNGHEACAYIRAMLASHGDLVKYIRGVHLHQSLTGDYVKEWMKQPLVIKEDFYERFAQAYEHVFKIDKHQPMLWEETKLLIQAIAPQYLVYEFYAKDRQQREAYLRKQAELFQKG